MNVACTDIAARGRVVATLAEAKDLLDARLGIKKRKTTVLALNDLVFDVFIFLGRKELDMLQVVNRRFNDVIDSKMTLVCLRHLVCAEIVPSVEEQQFLLGFEESGTKKTSRFPTGVDNPDEAGKAFALLVHA
ncbi:hypothetical protein AAVH_34295 [Aphelenchoides avenae]|nr:hypothetical protein AAVH_34295 [Aphelenchus avenae]